jgi:DNA-binding phage protein
MTEVKLKTTRWNSADYLKTPRDIAEYLDAVLEDGDLRGAKFSVIPDGVKMAYRKRAKPHSSIVRNGWLIDGP